MSGQLYCAVRAQRSPHGMVEVESLPFSYSHSGICSPRFTFIKFFQEVRFCCAKAYFIENVSAKPEVFRRYKANRFNLPLRIAGRADTLYSKLTARCSHPKTFPLKSFGPAFSKAGGGVGGNAPDIRLWGRRGNAPRDSPPEAITRPARRRHISPSVHKIFTKRFTALLD